MSASNRSSQAPDATFYQDEAQKLVAVIEELYRKVFYLAIGVAMKTVSFIRCGLRVGAILAMTYALGAPRSPTALAEDSGSTGCRDVFNISWYWHSFGPGGSCFQGAPNRVHPDWQDGLCVEYHYACQ